jgi:methionine-rich copper-binding protein CopC
VPERLLLGLWTSGIVHAIRRGREPTRYLRRAIIALLALGAAMAIPVPPAHAQVELTEANPPDGAQLERAPDVVHLCFSEPVNIDDTTTFAFSYEMPEGRHLGLRIVFQPDGECADVYPGLPDERPAGDYTFEWQVTAAAGDEEGSGTLHFDVTASSTASESPSPTPGGITPAATASPEGGAETGDNGNGGGPDILFLALITIASVGGAAVLFTMGYLLRRRIRYEPHRPPEDEGQGEGH